MPLIETTDHGFMWGAIDVKCLTSHKDNVFLGLETPKTSIVVRVTKSGKVEIRDDKTKKLYVLESDGEQK